MSATRTFTPTKTSAISAADPRYGYIGAERIRQALDMAMYCGLQPDLGGDERGILVSVANTFQAVNGARTFDLNGDTLGGLTLEAVVFYYTGNADSSPAGSSTVNVRLRQTSGVPATAGSIASPSSTSTVTREVFTVTLASGIETYQLQVTGSDTTYAVYCWGYLRLRKVAA